MENIFVSEGHRALYNEITYLKKRIHLVEGERKANYESNEAVIKKNDAVIMQIKETNKNLKQKRKSMVDTRSNYFKKISNVLGGEKKAYEFKDKDVREVLEILEYKIGALKNKLNILDYKRIHYTKNMDGALQAEVTLRKKIFKKKAHHSDSRIDELKATETSTAAMQMKTTEAENVRARYKHMLRVLKDENYTQIIKLTDLEKNIEKQQKEIIRIHSVLKDANKARKSAKAHLLHVEEETIQEYSGREQELYEARMKLKIIRDKMESIGSKLSYPKFHIIHRDSSVTDGLFPPMNALSDMGEGSKSLSTIEAVYFELQELTGESDPKLLVQRFEKQRQHAKELVKQEQTMKSIVRKAKLRRRFLADKVGQLQYSGGLTREELNEKADVINEEMNSTTTERDRLDNIINEQTVMMEQMLSKLIEICNNNDLRLSNSSRNDSPIGQKILTLLKHILYKTEQIVQEQTVTTSTPLLSPLTVRRHTTANTTDVNKDEEERLLGIDTTAKYRFGSTGDISLTGQDDISALGSRKPSLTDISMLDINPMDKLTVDGFDTANPAVSPMSDSTGFQLQLRIPDDDVREDSEKPKERTNFSTKGQESSEEEEAVTRNFVKRQSQILFEAKTRKGRFNPNATPATRHRRY
ncbi:unnamed protein product [Orchesella dallaii]|uniref:Uncharacterized protein n=1 Tax=Orchesella dallaii TaxID=48710 RepID=A0ABP1RM51_9HEXA